MKAALALFAALSLGACDNSAPMSVEGQDDRVVTATGATTFINPNPAAPSAAYFTLRGGANDTVLIGASSPDLARAEMHESRIDGGMMTMEPIARLPIPAGEQVTFRQGGRHVMLFGISNAARTRGNLTLTLDFADGPDQSVVLAFPPQAGVTPSPPSPPALIPVPPIGTVDPVPDNPSDPHNGPPPAHIAPAPRPPVIAAPAPMDHDKMDHHDH